MQMPDPGQGLEPAQEPEPEAGATCTGDRYHSASYQDEVAAATFFEAAGVDTMRAL